MYAEANNEELTPLVESSSLPAALLEHGFLGILHLQQNVSASHSLLDATDESVLSIYNFQSLKVFVAKSSYTTLRKMHQNSYHCRS